MTAFSLFAQAAIGGSFVHWAIWIVLAAAVIGLVMLGLRSSGVAIPPIVGQALWIVFGAVVVIAAIIFLARFAGSV